MQPQVRAARLVVRLAGLLLADARQRHDVVLHERREPGTQHGGPGQAVAQLRRETRVELAIRDRSSQQLEQLDHRRVDLRTRLDRDVLRRTPGHKHQDAD